MEMVTTGGNADAKLGEQMEGEEVSRKVECLRGRLLAERAASRNAKEEAELMETKLIELETRLKEETKSRNRAEKRLKFLMKKLDSLEIFYVSDESEQSSFVDKSEISSASSVASTSTNFPIQNIQETVENPPKSSVVPSGDLVQNVLQISASSSQSHDSPAADEEDAESTAQKSDTEDKCHANVKSSQIVNSLNCSIKEEILKGGGDEEQDDCVDNSMALVPVDLPKKTQQTIDPAVLDATVKEVLDDLKHAKEKLQTSMEKRRMIRVG